MGFLQIQKTELYIWNDLKSQESESCFEDFFFHLETIKLNHLFCTNYIIKLIENKGWSNICF